MQINSRILMPISRFGFFFLFVLFVGFFAFAFFFFVFMIGARYFPIGRRKSIAKFNILFSEIVSFAKSAFQVRRYGIESLKTPDESLKVLILGS